MDGWIVDFIKMFGLPGAVILGEAWMIREQRKELAEARKRLEDITDKYAAAMVENAKTNIALANAFQKGH